MSQEKAGTTEAESIQLISSGSRYGNKPSDCISFIIGGITCWILSAAAFFLHSYFTYLLVAFGAGIAWIIPGFILRARIYKNIAKQKDGL